ncbi:MAG: dephospho-CoA kinase [Campylobacterota bacterium]|nr:dephospho-CoA kinase [Campylobacterota bacterium]
MAFKYAIALTGGIATGKSTVASLMMLNGVRIIDADTIAHKLLDENSHWIEDNFGEEYVQRGKVLRSKLGDIVFSDFSKKELLESFLHPKIRKEIEVQSEKQDQFKFPYLIDIPLFFEKKGYDIKESVVVYTPKEIQLDRFMKRNGFSKEDSLKRISSQLDIEKKKSLATYVIDNSKDLKHLQQECENFVEIIKKKYSSESE